MNTDIPVYIAWGQSNMVRPALPKALLKALERRGPAFEMVHVAVGGTALAGSYRGRNPTWHPAKRGELFDQLVTAVADRVAHVRAQGYAPVLADIFQDQKEGDGKVREWAEAYGENLRRFKAALLNKLAGMGLSPGPDTRWIMALIDPGHNDKRCPFAAIVRQEQVTAAANDPTIHLIDSAQVEFHPADVHYTKRGRARMGELMAERSAERSHGAVGYRSLTGQGTDHERRRPAAWRGRASP